MLIARGHLRLFDRLDDAIKWPGGFGLCLDFCFTLARSKSEQPFFGEKAIWLTLYDVNKNKQGRYQIIWSDDKGTSVHGKKKFGDRLTINYKQNKMFEVTVSSVMESFEMSLILVFVDKKNTMLGGPVFSKVTISKNLELV